MSTSKHIDKICIAVIACTLLITVLFMFGSSWGLTAVASGKGYENRLFNTDSVHKIDIVMDNWDDFIASCENEEYVSCSVIVDGEKYSNVALRAKGNTSLSNVSEMNSDRYSFKMEFDHYENGRTYYGLDKLCLNNLIQDNTMMKDYLVYQMMEEFGVDSPLCSYVYITVNGEDWGLYLAVEGVEDSFLERNYDSEGELYKPDSMSFGGGRGNGKDFDMSEFDFGDDDEDSSDDNKTTNNEDSSDSDNSVSTEGNSNRKGKANGDFNFPDNAQGGPGNFDPSNFNPADMFQGEDFDPSNMPGDFSFSNDSSKKGAGGFNFGGFGMGSDDVKLKYSDDNVSSYSNIFDNAKTDVSNKDKKRLINSLKNLTEYENLEETVDIEEVIRYFVVHNFVVNGDSYTGMMIHNYYLHESDGQLSMIPWDYNLAFGTFQGGDASSSVNSSIDNPVSNGSVDDRPMIGWIFSDEKYTDMYHETFSEFAEEWLDSGKLQNMIEETAELIKPYVEKDPTKFCTTEEFDKGVEAISKFVELRSEAVIRQLNGDDTKVDTADLNTSDMGTMNQGGGGFGGGGGNKPSGDFDPANKPSGEFDSSNMPSGDFDLSNMPSGDFDPSNMPSGGFNQQ